VGYIVVAIRVVGIIVVTGMLVDTGLVVDEGLLRVVVGYIVVDTG
jgi:hypothetical protein